jgi:hypothetical protein
MGNVVAIEPEKPAKKAHSRKFSYYLEDPKAQYLLTGTDERGKTVYFFKMHITGLKDRIFGPYDHRSMAVECFDTVLECALESFCEAQNSGRHKGNNGMEHIALPADLTPVPAR